MLKVAQRITQFFERDHLHEAALGRLREGVELLVGVLAAQAVQHPGLRRHDEAPGG